MGFGCIYIFNLKHCVKTVCFESCNMGKIVVTMHHKVIEKLSARHLANLKAYFEQRDD